MNETCEEGIEEQCMRGTRGTKDHEGVYEKHVRLLWEVREMWNERYTDWEDCGE